MCRFVAYLGTPIILDELLIRPANSLLKQSQHAREMAHPLNGDGFGLGWYARDVREEPGVFRSVTPAWANQNLLYNASLIRSDCLFAHVRAASEGVVSEANCHPFHYQRYLMMHNGAVPGFGRIKRALVDRLDEDLYLWIHGQTDSEHVFALFMQTVRDHHKTQVCERLDAEDLAACFQTTFDLVDTLLGASGIRQPASFNMMVTDGVGVVGTRYSTDPANATPTLYYAVGSRFGHLDGRSQMIADGAPGERAVLIASERLTADDPSWVPIPSNHCIAVDQDRQVVLLPMKGASAPG
jgi:predicted glutamine amidotransferase